MEPTGNKSQNENRNKIVYDGAASTQHHTCLLQKKTDNFPEIVPSRTGLLVHLHTHTHTFKPQHDDDIFCTYLGNLWDEIGDAILRTQSRNSILCYF